MTRDEKLQWGAGPWVDEDDHVLFEHAGLPCLLHRNSMGVWCGYAAVPPGHPYHRKHYSERVQADVSERAIGKLGPVAVLLHALSADDGKASLEIVLDVHGSLTYSEECQGEICHAPKPGEPADVWWFGFDCGHCDDLSPGLRHTLRELGIRDHDGEEYRDQAYVTAETKRLAEQLAAAGAS